MENATKKRQTSQKEEVKEQVNEAEVVPAAQQIDQEITEKLKARPGRLIIRNIQFEMNESHLRKAFEGFGKIIEVNVPQKPDQKINRGFAFIEFNTKDEAQKAIDAMNLKQWKGRTLALEFSVPKGSYEAKVNSLVQHTNLKREEAILPKVLREEKKVLVQLKEKKQEELEIKQQQEEKMKKIREKKKEKKLKKLGIDKEQQKEEEEKKKQKKKDQEKQCTLFVRNIGFETDENKFKEFMQKFGEIKYAVLCKPPQLKDDSTENQVQQPHKGSGFVQFKNYDSAIQLLELSRKVEEQLDKERKNFRLNNAPKQNLVSSLSLLQSEIELDGRRLIVKEQVSKDEASNIREKSKNEEKRQKSEEDKRNLNMAKEGLLNEEQWIHKEPALTKAVLELRQRLHIAKEKALKASPNLYISKIRLQIRNLPRREFFEPELKELMNVVAQEWSKTLDKESQKLHFKNKKLISHVKIMRDEQKQDTETGDSLASGQAFVEFKNEELALFAVRYLNNLEIVNKKGLIVDFSMEDQRALFKRKEKIDRWRKIAKDQKIEKEEQECQNEKEVRKELNDNQALDLGKHWQNKKNNKIENEQISNVVADKKIDQENNVQNLRDYLTMNQHKLSRGQRQRLKRKIARLDQPDSQPKQIQEAPQPSQKQQSKESVQQSAKEKIQGIIKKRDKKLQDKQDRIEGKGSLSVEEQKIKNQIKNKKKEARKQNKSKGEFGEIDDNFDKMLDEYKQKVLKKIQKIEKNPKNKEGDAFQEIDVSD